MGKNEMDPGKATAEWRNQDPCTLGTYSRMSLTKPAVRQEGYNVASEGFTCFPNRRREYRSLLSLRLFSREFSARSERPA
jgi:hypothetical protein